MTAQDKILHVANKLGLTSLKDMQASTGAVYDADVENAGFFFSNASRHTNPLQTNITDNQFEVNEALLVETVAFYAKSTSIGGNYENFQRVYGSNAVIVFDLIIGNKRVMKDVPVFGAGAPYSFANVANLNTAVGGEDVVIFLPRHQVFMEGAGVLIPPQVQYYVQYKVYNVNTGAVIATTTDTTVGCYLFGTRVLLNFNTSI
jgi:hypothetical protein